MDFSDIFLASALPVLKVVLLCGVGAVCARMVSVVLLGVRGVPSSSQQPASPTQNDGVAVCPDIPKVTVP